MCVHHVLEFIQGYRQERLHEPWIELRPPDGRINTQEVTGGGGHAGGKAGPLHFGLGTAKAAEVRVLWPDGKQSVWTPIGAGKQATLCPGSDNDLRVHTLAVDG